MWPFNLITSTFVDIVNVFLPSGKEKETCDQVCPVCLEAKAHLILLTNFCKHEKFICLVCAINYICEEIKSQREIKCFYPKCKCILDVSDILRINGTKSNEYCEILSQKLLKGMDIRYCAKKGCENGQLLEDKSILMKCSSCKTKTCINCNVQWHVGMTCKQFKISIHGKAAKQLEKEISLNENFIKKHCILCPNCKLPIQKNEGCNHLTCLTSNGKIGCNHEFCFICKQPWKPNEEHLTDCKYYYNR